MRPRNTWSDCLKFVGVLALLAGSFVACDGELLDVDDPDNIEPEEELSPAAAGTRFGGMLDDFREAYDDYVLYTGLHTDEFVLAGTFPTRIEVDERRPIADNGSINTDMWQPLSVSRATADQLESDFTGALGNEEFDQTLLEQGIGWAQLVGGYDRVFLAEAFCQSIFGGGNPDLPRFVDEEPESEPLSSQERMVDAVDKLESAEASASGASFPRAGDVATAARIGQARAHMFLGNFGTAADLVADVPDDFVLTIEYSAASPTEGNEVRQQTYGVNASLRWTIGDGTDGTRGIEVWGPGGERTWIDDDGDGIADRSTAPGYDEWLDQDLFFPPEVAEDEMDLEAFNGQTPVNAQRIYADQAAPIVLASGWEARMIEAEVELRTGSPGDAETIVNDLLTDPAQANNPIKLAVNPNLPSGAFDPVNFGDESLKGDLIELARARAAGLWLSGQRQGYARRLAEEFDDRLVALAGDAGGTDRTPGERKVLWPARSGVNSISLTVPDQEIDNNPNISQTCPSGLP